MKSRKSKFEGKKTKWEIKREKRPAKRKKQGKKPLVEPLTIAPTEERNAAAKQGKMVFYDGKKNIELPLILNDADWGKCSLQGVYKRHNGNIVTLRAFPETVRNRPAFIGFFSLEKGSNERFIYTNLGDRTFAYRQADLGHILVRESMRGESLGPKAASKTEREQMALAGTKGERKHSFLSRERFVRLFEKLGYREDLALQGHKMSKSGRFNPKDDLSKFHRIVAIDPKNGKARMFTFPIERKN
jgi:hypothetical protein